MAKPRRSINAWSTIIIFSLLMIDMLVWHSIFRSDSLSYPRMYFLNVTQGSSALLMLSGNVKIMVDSGGDNTILQKIDPLFADTDGSYINIAVISYPQIDNYQGYYYLLNHYSIGAFIYDGRSDTVDKQTWTAFLDIINLKKIPLITLTKGDSIRYGNSIINILSPDSELVQSADITDAALVEHIRTRAFSALLASDIGNNVVHMLVMAPASIGADILKIPYPAGNEPDGSNFIKNVAPRIVITQPGIKNTTSASSKTMISQLSSSTNAAIFNTAQDGMLMIYESKGKLRILKGS